MKRGLLFIGLSAVLFTACKSHYAVTNVSRSLLVVDSRYDQAAVPDAAAFLAPYQQKVDSVMNPVLGEAVSDMEAKRPESKLSNLLPDILVFMAKDFGEKPDFGVYNIGGIRAPLAKGTVTYGDVLAIAPFENKICFLTLTGEKVLELFSQIAMRGGEGVSKEVRLVISSDGKLVSAKVGGSDIDPKASYRITTIDYLSQGNDGMTAFKSCTDLVSPQDEKYNSRQIIADYFKLMRDKGQKVDAKVEGRIVVSN